MRKKLGIVVWWLFLAVVTVIVDTAFGGVPLWVMVIVAVVLGVMAIPLMFGQEIRTWRSNDNENPLRKDVIDYKAGVIWTKDERGYPVGATSIEDMKSGKLAPPPGPPPTKDVN